MDRRKAIENFIGERNAAGGRAYQDALNRNLILVSELFEATRDLLDFTSGEALKDRPARIQIARYLCGPPVSAEDLNTLADANIATKKRLDSDLAQRAARIITSAIDRQRFPWLFEKPLRRPTSVERGGGN